MSAEEIQPPPSFGYWHDQGCEKGFAGAETKVDAACGCEARLVRKLQRDVRRMASAVRLASSLLAKSDRRNALMLSGLADETVAPAQQSGGATQVLARNEQGERGFMTFVELTDAYGAWVALREASADPLDKAWLFVQGGELQRNDGAILLDADGMRELRDALGRALKHITGAE